MLMRYRPKGSPADDSRLGRYVSDSFRHIEKYPLRALPMDEQPKVVPVVIGVNWYRAMSNPIKKRDGWWLPEGNADLGPIDGGHCVCLCPIGLYESYQWYLWYDQVDEGICVSEGCARAMGLINRKRYQPRPLYDWAQANDEWDGASPTYEGTSVDAGMRGLMQFGLSPRRLGEKHYIRKGEVSEDRVWITEGISAFRWVTDINELIPILNLGRREWVFMLNSWGVHYPRRVKVPLSLLDRLLHEYGEFAVPTDR